MLTLWGPIGSQPVWALSSLRLPTPPHAGGTHAPVLSSLPNMVSAPEKDFSLSGVTLIPRLEVSVPAAFRGVREPGRRRLFSVKLSLPAVHSRIVLPPPSPSASPAPAAALKSDPLFCTATEALAFVRRHGVMGFKPLILAFADMLTVVPTVNVLLFQGDLLSLSTQV